ncbi:MAG: hypothetical protein LBS94_00770 [Prevotellaceae bacterium]|jgi:tetratricopeptide (TPR) repeat protein|nr:hypothetical protein [Prevotellaceae bacterium]
MWGKKFLYLLLIGSATLASPHTLAQATSQPAKATNSEAKKVVDQANSEIKKGADQINADLKKVTDKVSGKVNSKLEKVDEKIEDKRAAIDEKKERLKAKTIKKNTLVMRTYHNVTAYYNVYFNGNESFKEGTQKAAKDYPFDYTEILPMFTFEAKPIPEMVKTEMGRVLEKADKTIKKHSITIKPEIKKGKRLTKKDQEFYNRREFCNSIDDAYMLIAKANVYLHEYELAIMAFDLVAVEFPYEPTVYEARIWTAVVAGAKEDLPRERELIDALMADKKFPAKEYGKLLNSAVADVLIREKRYEEAIPKVELALRSTWSRVERQRYHFILGQLYQKIGKPNVAIGHYNRLIRSMPSYDLEFHARLNKAFLSTGAQGESMKKMLLKMAKDEKNKDYLDKIYYALAEIEMNAKHTEQGVEYYRLSAANAKPESPQRLLSCYTLAKYFEAHGEYESAQAYYDSTATVMPKDHPDYSMVSNKALNLGKLAANLRIIKTEDSLQHIARMSDKEREKYVKTQIAQAKTNAERREREEEHRAVRAEVAAASAANLATPTTGKWYFYNPQLIVSGLAEFRKTWGTRKLADNWRRESKALAPEFAMPSSDGSPPQDNDVEQLPEDQTEEFYLANVPFTDTLMAESNTRLMEAMFDAAMVYKNDIRDQPNAIAMYETLLKRFPDTRHQLEAYFYLYVLYHEAGNEPQADKYKELLYTKYPDELLTKYVKDPSYVSDKMLYEKEANQLFEDAYSLYQKGEYGQAVALATQGASKYVELPVAANLKLLHVMATGGSSRNIGQYIAGLNEVVSAYPGTDVATIAADMLERVKKHEISLISERDSMPQQDTAAAAAVGYTTDDGESAYILVLEKEGLDQNQLRFNFIAFNADIDADELNVELAPLSDQLVILKVGKFKTLSEACVYYKKVKAFPGIFKDIAIKNNFPFAITQNNLTLFEQSKIISAYDSFFRSSVLPNFP